MKKLLLLLVLLVPMLGTSQWAYETVDNGFDEAYKIAYTKRVGGAYLKLENVDGEIVLYIQGVFFCDDDDTEVDISYMVKGKWEKYNGSGMVSNDQTTVFMEPNMLASGMLEDFLAATSVKIRIRQTYCDEQVYEFNMAGSTKALNYMK
jgi:hypothetical protein